MHWESCALSALPFRLSMAAEPENGQPSESLAFQPQPEPACHEARFVSRPAFMTAFDTFGCGQEHDVPVLQQRPPHEFDVHSTAAEQSWPAPFFPVHIAAEQ